MQPTIWTTSRYNKLTLVAKIKVGLCSISLARLCCFTLILPDGLKRYIQFFIGSGLQLEILIIDGAVFGHT